MLALPMNLPIPHTFPHIQPPLFAGQVHIPHATPPFPVVLICMPPNVTFICHQPKTHPVTFTAHPHFLGQALCPALLPPKMMPPSPVPLLPPPQNPPMAHFPPLVPHPQDAYLQAQTCVQRPHLLCLLLQAVHPRRGNVALACICVIQLVQHLQLRLHAAG